RRAIAAPPISVNRLDAQTPKGFSGLSSGSLPCCLPSVLSFNPAVHSLVEKLVKLQAVDLERARLAQTARALPAEAAQAQAALDKAQQESASLSDALNREESLRTRLEREINTHRDKATRYRAQLDSVTTPA